MSNKRQSPFENKTQALKKRRSDLSPVAPAPKKSDLPVYKRMRPTDFLDIVGQDHLFGHNGIIRNFFQKNEIPSMILCGPHGCGKVKKNCSCQNGYSNSNLIFRIQQSVH